ncbi:MAG: hypothetical protein H7Z43_07535 [Clostridia bacterium]|nr:hypothetical protein [Deltaproteobacteria bacterium]
MTGPVMTFQAAGVWFAVRVDSIDRVVGSSEERARRLWPVPMTCAGYAGLFDDGQQLVPVLDLVSRPEIDCALAVVRVNGMQMGLRVERTGAVLDEYSLEGIEGRSTSAYGAHAYGALPGRAAVSADQSFWLLDLEGLHASLENNLLNRIH